MNTSPITREVLLDTTISRVWKAITDAQQLRQWFKGVHKFEPTVGYEFNFYEDDGHDYNHLCRVIEVVPERKLVYTLRYENRPGSSVVTFELEEQEGKTKVKLTHEGIESFAENGPEYSRESFISEWEQLLDLKLKKHLEQGHFD